MSFQENKEENSHNTPVDDANGKSKTSSNNTNSEGGSQNSETDQFSEFNDSESNVPHANNTEDETHAAHPHDHESKIASLEAELENVNTKLSETHNRMLRIAADAENTRKRMEKEKADTRVYCIQEFARDLLPVLDSFEKALQTIEHSNDATDQNAQLSSLTEGVKLVSKILHDVTKKHGIERLPGKDAPFNPMYHNAISKEANADYKTETVIEEFLPGYKIGDRILRTALVKVGAPD